MRLVTLDFEGGCAGIIVGSDVLNLKAAASLFPEAVGLPATVLEILQAGESALASIRAVEARATTADRQQLHARGALQPLSSAKLLAPVKAGMVLSCGMNYRAHLHEMGGPLPSKPTGFLKSVNAIIGPDAAIVLPATHPDMVDWEAEFCGVIGKRCHNVSKEEALDYVVGYTMINDVSARNWVRHPSTLSGMEGIQAWDLNTLGKQFPTFCPMGPAIATKDEIPDPNNARFELKLNGAVKQSACTDDLMFDLASLISYYSQWYVFEPGDVISTGSPAGVGMGQKPFVFLQDGDVVEISASGIGTMRNPVVASSK